MTVINSRKKQNCVGTLLITLPMQGVESLVYKVKATPHAIKHGTFSPNFTYTLISTKFASAGELAKRKIIC
jgi:hypothetical protein